MEASVAGAHVLREHGIRAQSIPCAMRAWDSETYYLTSGYTRAELAGFAGDREPDSIYGPEDSAFHVVIEAFPGGVRTIIDLTAGQLIPTSLTLAFPSPDWPRITTGAWTIEYDDSPRARELKVEIAKAEAALNPALLEDIRDLHRLALSDACRVDWRVDKEQFYRQLEAQLPSAVRGFIRIVDASHARFRGKK